MTIEATLLSIDTTLKALLASVQAGAQMAAEFSGAEPSASRKRRTKAEIAADEAAEAAAKQAATKGVQDESEKAGAAKNDQSVATAPVTAPTEPSATAQQADASAAASEKATWDEAVAKLKSLLTLPEHGAAAVVKVIQKIDPASAKVTDLKDRGFNDRIVAEVEALLTPAGDDIFG